MFLYPWDGCLRDSLDFPIGYHATCCLWCEKRDGDGANAGEMHFILSWFWVHQSILHSWGDISVLLVLWQSCWGLSRVQSSKSRILMCLIGNTEFLCTQCSGIRPHLAARWKSHWVFSICGRHLECILELRLGWPFETRVCSAKAGLLFRHDRQLRNLK